MTFQAFQKEQCLASVQFPQLLIEGSKGVSGQRPLNEPAAAVRFGSRLGCLAAWSRSQEPSVSPGAPL